MKWGTDMNICLKTPAFHRISALAVFTCIVFASGCTDITEYENLTSGVLTVYTENFEVLKEVHGIEEARQILVCPGFVFVITGEGTIEKYDSETLELLGSYMIGQPSPAGYYLSAFSPRESTLYVIGSLGNVIEVSIPGCSVVDEFSVCSSPTKISVSNTAPAYLYVSDGLTNNIHVIRCSTNTPAGSRELVGGILCIEASESDTVLVGTELATYLLYFRSSGELYSSASGTAGGDFRDLEYFPWYNAYAAVRSSSLGVLEFIEDPDLHIMILTWGGEYSIAGTNHLLSCDPDRYYYVVSIIDNNIFRIVQYDMAIRNISSQIDVNGIPLDVSVSGSGLIYVLSLEN